jgi:hypothetical protein
MLKSTVYFNSKHNYIHKKMPQFLEASSFYSKRNYLIASTFAFTSSSIPKKVLWHKLSTINSKVSFLQ